MKRMVQIYIHFEKKLRRNKTTIVFLRQATVALAFLLALISSVLGIMRNNRMWFVVAGILSVVFAALVAYILRAKEVYNRKIQIETIKKEVVRNNWLGEFNDEKVYEWLDKYSSDKVEGFQGEITAYKDANVSFSPPVPDPSEGQKLSPGFPGDRNGSRERSLLSPSFIVGLGSAGIGILEKIEEQFDKEYGQVNSIVKYFPLNPTGHPGGESLMSGVSESRLGAYIKNITRHPKWQNWLIPPCHSLSDLPVRDIAAHIRKARKYGRFLLAVNSKEEEIDSIEKIIEHDLANLTSKPGAIAARKQGVTSSHVVNIVVITPSYDPAASGMFLDLVHLLRSLARAHTINYVLYGIVLLPSMVSEQREQRAVQAIWANAFTLLKEIETATRKEEFDNYEGEKIKASPCDMCFLVGLPKGRTMPFSRVSSLVAENVFTMLSGDNQGRLNRLAPSGFDAFSGISEHLEWLDIVEFLGKKDAKSLLGYVLGDKNKNAEESDQVTAGSSTAAFLADALDETCTPHSVTERLEEKLNNLIASGAGLPYVVRFLTKLADYSAFLSLTSLEYINSNDSVGVSRKRLKQLRESSEALLDISGGYSRCFLALEKKLQAIQQNLDKRSPDGRLRNQLEQTKLHWMPIAEHIDLAQLTRRFPWRETCAMGVGDLQGAIESLCESLYMDVVKGLSVTDVLGEDCVKNLKGRAQLLWESDESSLQGYDSQSLVFIHGADLRTCQDSLGLRDSVVTIPTPHRMSYLRIYRGLPLDLLDQYAAYRSAYYEQSWLDRFFLRRESPGIEYKELVPFSFAWAFGQLESQPHSWRWRGRNKEFPTISGAFWFYCCEKDLLADTQSKVWALCQRKGESASKRVIHRFVQKLKQSNRALSGDDQLLASHVVSLLEMCSDGEWQECMNCLEQNEDDEVFVSICSEEHGR